MRTHILNFFNSKICVGGYADFSRLDVDDHQQRVWCISLEKLIDFKIRGSELWASMIPSYELLLGVDLLEHIIHRFDEVVVQEPDRGVLLIFLEGNYRCGQKEGISNCA